MAVAKCVTGCCMHVSADVLRVCGGTVFNVNGTDRGWRPDDGDRLFMLGYRKRGREVRTWYLLIMAGGSAVFLRRLSVGDTSSELRLTSKSKLPDIVRILAEWIMRKEHPTVA